MKISKIIALGLATIGSISSLNCFGSDLGNQLTQTNQPIISGKRWEGADCHMDVYVRPEWIAERRRVPVNLDEGKIKEIQLTPAIKDGVQLRLKGHAPNHTGDLYLHVHVVK